MTTNEGLVQALPPPPPPSQSLPIALSSATSPTPEKMPMAKETESVNKEHTDYSNILQNNEEYVMISRAIDALKSQLTRARSDMEKLVDIKRLALSDPAGYVESLLTNTAPQAPLPLEVVDLPTVYVEPYIGCADTAKVQQYMDCVREQVGKGADKLPFILMGSNVARPLPLSTNISSKSVNRRRTSQISFTAGSGQLTGNTAVGTPEEKSPERHIPNTAATLLPSPINTTIPPRIERASTEPPAFVATKQPRNFQNIVSSRPAETQPGTPTRQGRSQKTLTPQMLEEFRRQVSEKQNPVSDNDNSKPGESGSDDDEYYNALVRASMTEGAKPNKDANSDSSDSDAPLMSVLPAGSSVNGQQQPTGGKSISFNNLPQPRTSMVNGGFRRRGRGRPPYKVISSGHGNNRNNRDPRLPRGDDDGKPKSASFNMPWTDKEQERLEELLNIYPDEEVSNNRWRKISKALGTRTMRQVSSRVQKYFIKLARAGLPVPGRVPGQLDRSFSTMGSPSPRRGGTRVSGAHLDNSVRKRKRGRPPKRKHVDFTSSSSESEQEEDIDMMMAEAEDNNHHQPLSLGGNPKPYDRKGKQPDMSLSENVEFIGGGVRGGFGHLEFGNSYDDDQLYTAVPSSSSAIDGSSGSYANIDMSASGSNVVSSSRSAGATAPSTSSQAITPALRSAKAVHLGYRCDSCFAEPIVGIRWHCLQCKGAQTVDLCDECREEGVFENSHHVLSHSFHAVRDAEMEPYYANEVAASALREYSYLA